MKIVKLTSNNVLRLTAVEITPEGNLIVIGGENEQGKTSVLDSIMLAMGGKQAKHKKPLHDGAKNGSITCELDEDIVVKRTFTAGGGGLLTITNKAGTASYKSPQKMLDQLVGTISFDPLRWANMTDKDQLPILKQLVGLDFTAEEAKRKAIYDDRKMVNQKVREIEAEINAIGDLVDVPGGLLEMEDFMKELDIANAHNESKNEKSREIANSVGIKNMKLGKIESIDAKIKDLSDHKKAIENDIDKLNEGLKELDTELAEIIASPIEIEPIKEKISQVEDQNLKFREAEKRDSLSKKLVGAKTESNKLTESIKTIDTDKAHKIANAKFPVEKMSFDETGVLFKGIPFSQASSEEKLVVSLNMGIAINPELKVILIRDGSLLDQENLKKVAEIADEKGYQVWLERVGKGEECQVIIEDGRVME